MGDGSSDMFRKGLSIRQEVMGADGFDEVVAKSDHFMRAIQEVGVGWAWGVGWGDETIDRKTRSLICLAMLTVLNRMHEFKLHVRGALNNGATVDEISSVLIQATAYAGVPAGVNSFRAAHEILVEENAI